MRLSPSRIAAAAKAYGKKIYKKLVKPTIRAAKKSLGYKPKLGPKVNKRHIIDSDQWADEGKWVQVISSNVKGIMYDSDDKLLHVEFLSKGRGVSPIYVYYGVPETVAKNLFNATSVGSTLHWTVKVKYNYSRLR